MKPSFALNLSHEGIRLFSRAKGGWRLVGETELDTPELGETLAYLRDKATRLSGSGLSCKLVLPNSQILFTSVTAPGPDDQSREAQIREALTGMTPYAPEELAFTWRISGDLVNVAAVARETLQEAEAFAVEHRFNPVSFVGDAAEANFDGEPFFGATAFSETLLDPEDSVEADTEAFVILEQKPSTGRKIFSGSLRESVLLTPAAEAKSTEAKLEGQATLETQPDVPQETADVPPSEETQPTDAADDRSDAIPDEPVAGPDQGVAPDTAPETPPSPENDATPADPPEAERDTPAPHAETEAPPVEAAPVEDADPTPEDAEGPQDTSLAPELSEFFTTIRAATPVENSKPVELPPHLAKAKGTTSVPEAINPKRKSFGASRDETGDAGGFVHRPLAAGKPPEALAARLSLPNSAPTPPKAAPASTETERDVEAARSRIKKGIVSGVSGVASSLKRKPQERSQAASDIEEDAAEKPVRTAATTAAATAGAFKRFAAGKSANKTTEVTSDETPDTSADGKAPKPQEAVAAPVISESASKQAEMPEESFGANVTGATLDLPNSEDLAASLNETAPKSGRAAKQSRKNEAEALTVFGAQKSLSDRGKPRHLGLILSAGLVLLMGGAAFWSLRGGDISAENTDVSASEAFTAFNETLETPTENTTTAALSAAPEAIEVPSASAAQVAPDAELETEDLPADPLPVTEGEEQAEAEIDVVEQPDEPEEPEVPAPFTTDEALAAYAESGIWQKSPAALPAPDLSTTDTLYQPSLDPIVDLSDAVALPNAAEPDDVPLPTQPSPAPAGSTFTLAEDGLVIPSAEGTMNPDGILVFKGPPAKRSSPRPDTGGVGRSTDTSAPAISTRRPAGRPTDLSEQQEKASLGGRTRTELARLRPKARPLSDQIIAQTDADGTAASTSATDAAVARALIPISRPAGFAALVETARANPENIQTPTAAVAQRPAATGPTIPTRASVAKEATQEDAINTRKVSLIGVYGTASSRTALIRMKNGRTVEVKIGDRVDGGKVAAIGADQVRYVKGGRNILLKMPTRG